MGQLARLTLQGLLTHTILISGILDTKESVLAFTPIFSKLGLSDPQLFKLALRLQSLKKVSGTIDNIYLYRYILSMVELLCTLHFARKITCKRSCHFLLFIGQ